MIISAARIKKQSASALNRGRPLHCLNDGRRLSPCSTSRRRNCPRVCHFPKIVQLSIAGKLQRFKANHRHTRDGVSQSMCRNQNSIDTSIFRPVERGDLAQVHQNRQFLRAGACKISRGLRHMPIQYDLHLFRKSLADEKKLPYLSKLTVTGELIERENLIFGFRRSICSCPTKRCGCSAGQMFRRQTRICREFEPRSRRNKNRCEQGSIVQLRIHRAIREKPLYFRRNRLNMRAPPPSRYATHPTCRGARITPCTTRPSYLEPCVIPAERDGVQIPADPRRQTAGPDDL